MLQNSRTQQGLSEGFLKCRKGMESNKDTIWYYLIYLDLFETSGWPTWSMCSSWKLNRSILPLGHQPLFCRYWDLENAQHLSSHISVKTSKHVVWHECNVRALHNAGGVRRWGKLALPSSSCGAPNTNWYPKHMSAPQHPSVTSQQAS